MVDAIAAMRVAFGRDRDIPARQMLGSSLFMPGRVGATTGIKVVSTVPGNPVGIVVVFDGNGNPLGLVDGPTLTAIRTGAVSGLATDLLADPDASSLTMLGAGAMARDQIAAVKAVREIRNVYVWSRNGENAERLSRAIGATPIADANEAVSLGDIVSTATPATSPLFDRTALRESAHINAVGAYTPTMVEVPPEAVNEAFVAVDDYEATAREAGDLIRAGCTPDADLTELLEGVDGNHTGLTLFKSVGIASQDIAAARSALENAERMGLGIELD